MRLTIEFFVKVFCVYLGAMAVYEVATGRYLAAGVSVLLLIIQLAFVSEAFRYWLERWVNKIIYLFKR